MKCPPAAQLDLLAMDALEDGAEAQVLEHLRACPTCRQAYEAARRAHCERLRMYDQFDRGHDDLREQLMAALPPEPDRSRADWLARGWHRLGDWTVSTKHRVSGRAAAAGLAVAACLALGAILFVSAGRQSAFAAAIEQFQRASTIVCSLSSPSTVNFAGMEFTPSGKLYISAEYGGRYESYGNGILASIQYTPPDGPITVVNPLARNYMVIDDTNASEATEEGTNPYEFIQALQRLSADADSKLGRKEIDGVEAIGYEITGRTLGMGVTPGTRSELWIDAETDLPLRYVAEFPGFEPDKTMTLVYDHFEWDKPLDPDLFTPVIPDGFTRLDAKMPAVEEATLINGLDLFAELTGKYPTDLSMPVVVGELASGIASHVAAGEEADQQTLAQQSIEIGAGCAFYQTLIRDGRSPEYFGDTVTPDDPDAVLLRWKLPGGRCREVYGDLQVDDVPCPE